MKEKSIVIASYALLVILGGVIGAIVAKSAASLIASGIFGTLLLICAIFIWKGHAAASTASMALVALLFAFFTYRYFLTFKPFPGAVMGVISLGMLVYLFLKRK